MHMIGEFFLTVFNFIGKSLILIFFRIRYSMKVTFLQRVPLRGPYIITPNHESVFDPPLSGIFLLNPVRYMAKKELFKNPLMALALYLVGSLPLERRGFDATTIRRVVYYLKKGSGMVIFPEGTRSKTGEIMAAKPGIGLILQEADYPPIIPLRIKGSRSAEKRLFSFSRPKIALIYGYPFCINRHYPWGNGLKERSQKMANHIMEHVKQL